MKPRIIRADELKENDYGDTKITDILNNEDFPQFSIAKVRKVGDDIKLGLDQDSYTSYYVLEGEGICIIEDKEYNIKKGDTVLLPPGTKYKNMKGLTLLAISSPRFDRKRRIYFE